MSRRPAVLKLVALLPLVILLAARPARADGGHIELHSTYGAYTLTLFSAPNPLTTGPADLSVLVQDSETGVVITDVQVEAKLTGPLSGSTHGTGQAPYAFGGNDMPGMGATPAKAEPEKGATLLERYSPRILPMTHAQASNPLMLAASPEFKQPGDYQLTMTVTRTDSVAVHFTTVLHVTENHQRRTALLFAILLPLAAILLFLVNQGAKQATVARG